MIVHKCTPKCFTLSQSEPYKAITCGFQEVDSPAPMIYYSPGNLNIGSGAAVAGTNPACPVYSSPPPTASCGQGILMVDGDLTMDFSNGFDYYGLIIVKGNVTMKVNPTLRTTSNIHGAIIAGGKFYADGLNLQGGIYNMDLRSNPCFVYNSLNQRPLAILSFRELQ